MIIHLENECPAVTLAQNGLFTVLYGCKGVPSPSLNLYVEALAPTETVFGMGSLEDSRG